MMAATLSLAIALLPAQFDALTRPEPHVGYVGGLGSGKTYLGKWWLIERAWTMPKSSHLATANTYPQLRDVVMPNLRDALAEGQIPFVENKSEHTFTLGNGSRILCRSIDTCDALRGVELASWWGDEARDYTRYQVDVLLGRLRDARHGRPRLLFTTTPNGYTEIHRRFVKDRSPGWAMVTARTADNPHLPDWYEAQLREAYRGTPELAAQDLDGAFTTLAGTRAYKPFDRARHLRPVDYEPDLPLHLTWDFNVGLCPCIAVQEVMVGEVLELRVVAEVVRRNTRLDDMADAVLHRFRGHRGPVHIYGDANAGRHVQTGKTTWAILLERLAELRPEKSIPTENPPQIDRVNSVNYVLAGGRYRVLVDPACEVLAHDLEAVHWDEKLGELSKRDLELTHASDGFGYFVHRRHRPQAFRADTRAMRELPR